MVRLKKGFVSIYRWTTLSENGEIDFCNYDEVFIGGRKGSGHEDFPKYSVACNIVPIGRKRKVWVELAFDEDRKYIGIRGHDRCCEAVIKKIEQDTLKWLVDFGFAEDEQDE